MTCQYVILFFAIAEFVLIFCISIKKHINTLPWYGSYNTKKMFLKYVYFRTKYNTL